MVQSVESRIHKLLLEHGDSLKVADLLLKDWDSGSLAWVEQNAVGHFLIKCGYFRAFMDQVVKNLKQGQRMPWSSFMEALSLSKTQLSKDDFDQIFVGAAEEQSLRDLVKCVGFDDQDPRFKKIRNSMDNTILRKEAPVQVHEESNDAKTRAIQSSPPPASSTSPITSAPPAFSPQNLPPQEFYEENTSTIIRRVELREATEESARRQVKDTFEAALRKIQKTDSNSGSEDTQPLAIQEAAIALAMMGAWKEGLEFLKKMAPGFKKSFLELQFLLSSGKNLEVLELSDSLLAMSPNLEQKSFIQFIQAQALINLKRTSDAHSVLEDLLKDDPDHYSARALMSQIKARSK